MRVMTCVARRCAECSAVLTSWAEGGQMSQTEANCASLRRGVKVGGTNAAPDCFRLRLAISS